MSQSVADVGETALPVEEGRGETWLPIETAPKDRTRILVQLKNPLPVEGRPDLDPWHGITFVASHNGVETDGFDIGWQFAAPVGQGGFPDNWMAGWMPLPFGQLVTIFTECQTRGLSSRGACLSGAFEMSQGESGAAWQPIETAPRDGTEVDLFGFPMVESTKRVRIVDCHFHCGEWLRWGDWTDIEGSWDVIANPTHWQPLPTPPEQSS